MNSSRHVPQCPTTVPGWCRPGSIGRMMVGAKALSGAQSKKCTPLAAPVKYGWGQNEEKQRAINQMVAQQSNAPNESPLIVGDSPSIVGSSPSLAATVP